MEMTDDAKKVDPTVAETDNAIDGEEPWKFQRQREDGQWDTESQEAPDDTDRLEEREAAGDLMGQKLDPRLLRPGAPSMALVKADPEVKAGLVKAEEANTLSLTEAAPIMADMVPAGRLKGKSGLALREHIPQTRVVQHLGKQFPTNWHPPPNRATPADREFLSFWDEYWATAGDEDEPTEDDFKMWDAAYRAVHGSKNMPKRGVSYRPTDKPCPECRDDDQLLHYDQKLGLWKCFRCGHDTVDSTFTVVQERKRLTR